MYAGEEFVSALAEDNGFKSAFMQGRHATAARALRKHELSESVVVKAASLMIGSDSVSSCPSGPAASNALALSGVASSKRVVPAQRLWRKLTLVQQLRVMLGCHQARGNAKSKHG